MKRIQLKGVTKNDVRPIYYLEIFIDVICDDFQFSVVDVWELMDEQVQVVTAGDVRTHRNLVIGVLLKITILMSGADEIARYLFIITNFRFIRIFVFLQRLATYVTFSRNVVLLLLCAEKSFHWTIVFKCLMHFRSQSIKVLRNLPSALILLAYQV